MQQIRVITKFSLKKELSNAILKSLKPDNVNFPEGLEMEMYADDDLTIIFTCHDLNKMRSMISVIDEVLEHISIILNTIGEGNDRS